MEILGFLFGLGCLVLIVWEIALVTGVVFGHKRQQIDQSHKQPSLQLKDLLERPTPQHKFNHV